LPDAISISHAGLAQIFFALTVTLALVTSRTWRRPPTVPVDDAAMRRRAVALTALIYGQILLGATMRHTGAGLAIPDFPLSYGHLLPPFWTHPIAIHFAHRVGAFLVASAALAVIVGTFRRHGDRSELTRPASLLGGLIATQITLGAYVVLTSKQPIVNTLHVATGALVFVTSLVLTLRLFRARLDVPVHAE